MKKERFIVVATSDAEHHKLFAVMVEGYHLRTMGIELKGVSKAGKKKLDRLVRRGFGLLAYYFSNMPKIIGWRD